MYFHIKRDCISIIYQKYIFESDVSGTFNLVLGSSVLNVQKLFDVYHFLCRHRCNAGDRRRFNENLKYGTFYIE